MKTRIESSEDDMGPGYFDGIEELMEIQKRLTAKQKKETEENNVLVQNNQLMAETISMLFIFLVFISSVCAQNSRCDWEKTNIDYKSSIASTMFSYRSKDSTNFYTVRSLAEKMEIYYGSNIIDSLPCIFGSDYKKVTCKDRFLELHLFTKNKKGEINERTFFFVKGTEIRNLVQGISIDENFDIKTYQDEFLFEFRNGDYGRYAKSYFCRLKKP